MPQDKKQKMATRILLTTTSYQDTPGKHHKMLEDSGFEVVRARGPLKEEVMLQLIEEHKGFDGFLNGDDEITEQVLKKAQAAERPLKVVAKYGIGLDSIDVTYCTSQKMPVLFTPGVNHTTVAEHALGLMVACSKHFWTHMNAVKTNKWQRKTGIELAGKTLGIMGLGRIGREVALRAKAFGMTVIAYDVWWPNEFAEAQGIERKETGDDVVKECDVLSLHMNLDDSSRGFINKDRLATMKDGSIIINTARGGLVIEADVAEACKSGKLYGYGTDVLMEEPITNPHPYDGIDNVIITPHIGSRTLESVERQACRATQNIVQFLSGGTDFIQANKF